MNGTISRRQFLSFGGAAAVVTGLGLLGCSSSSVDDAATGSAEAELSGSISCSGATSFQSLIEAAADEFYGIYPNVSIAISAGGSGQGLSQVAEGSVQIGRSDVFAETKLEADQLEGLVDNQIAVVGMGPIVHADVDVDNLTLEQLKAIFTGEITNWNELGGSDSTIQVIQRESGSGTRATFEDVVLGDEVAPDSFRPVAEVDSSGTVIEQVAQTEGAISYVAFNYMENEGIKALSVEGIEPSRENVECGDFPIWSYEHMYTREDESESTKAVTDAFIEFLLSDDVQQNLVPEQGFIPVADMQVQKDAEGNVTSV